MIRQLSTALILSASGATAQPFAHTYPQQFTDRERMAEALSQRLDIARPWMQTPSTQAMLETVGTMPPRIRRWLWSTRSFSERTFTLDQYAELDAEARRLLDFFGISELIYYAGWSTDAPFVELRAYDLAFLGTPYAEPQSLAGARILLVDPSVITPAWMLARLGADVTVVSDSQRFRALYNAPSDQGVVRGINGAPDGRVTIVDANWPAAGPGIAGEGNDSGADQAFDLIVAINSLSKGRVDPSPSQVRTLDVPLVAKPLGLDPVEIGTRIFDALAPGGRAITYSWGSPARPNNDPSFDADVRPAVGPSDARAAGLVATAVASDASVFTRMLGARANIRDLRRPLEENGVTAPQVVAFYAVYDKPPAEN
ncbi:MAG: hypothetical protein AAFR76_03210 [Planctomycetota bacterium]